MVGINTHREISEKLCGVPLEAGIGSSRVEMATTREMVVDDRGLIHDGFVFGLAEYTAMIAVNDPPAVSALSTVRFLQPVRVGEVIVEKAVVQRAGGKSGGIGYGHKRRNTGVHRRVFLCCPESARVRRIISLHTMLFPCYLSVQNVTEHYDCFLIR
jgi:acyl-coenzyme A thioesterase PaaI-like protein